MAEKILIISPVPLFPGHAGNRERIRAICTELMKSGYILDLFYTGFMKELSDDHDSFFNGAVLEYQLKSEKVQWRKNPLSRIREVLYGFKIKADKWYRFMLDGISSARFNRSLTEYKNIGKQLILQKQINRSSYKAVVINYAPYSFYFDLFDESTIKIIDTHDRLTDRFKMYIDSSNEPVDWHSLRENDERKALLKADVVWAITDEEKNFFQKLIAKSQVQIYTLSHLIPFQHIRKKESGNALIMIGSMNRLNLDGLTWFLEQVWKKIKHYQLDLEFIIAGSICSVIDESLLDDNIELYGRFESASEIYSRGDLFINPMQEGTGLKIKTFEALAHGKYVLATKAGSTGLQNVIGNGLIYSNDPAVWIKEIKNFFERSGPQDMKIKQLKSIMEDMYQDNLSVIKKSLESTNRR